MVGLEAAIH